LLAIDVPFEFGSWLGSVRCAVDLNLIPDMVPGEASSDDGAVVG
jgi:hypothetical protein